MSEPIAWEELVKMRQACAPKLTQRAMAVRLGISAMYMSDLEHGKRAISESRRAKYQKELELFLLENPPMAPAPTVEAVIPDDHVPATETVTAMAETFTIAPESPQAEASDVVIRPRVLATDLPHVAVDAPVQPENPPATP